MIDSAKPWSSTAVELHENQLSATSTQMLSQSAGAATAAAAAAAAAIRGAAIEHSSIDSV